MSQKSTLLSTLSSNTPSADLSDIAQALWWLKKGDFKLGDAWETAHEICQASEGSKPYDWVHALAHWIEGDDWNADYWYRRVGENRHGATIAEEWDYLVDQLV